MRITDRYGAPAATEVADLAGGIVRSSCGEVTLPDGVEVRFQGYIGPEYRTEAGCLVRDYGDFSSDGEALTSALTLPVEL